MSRVSLAAPFNCLSPKTHQNIANFTHTTCRLVKHVALFAIRVNKTMNQGKKGKKGIRVYKTGHLYVPSS